jgi:hypothetical protein
LVQVLEKEWDQELVKGLVQVLEMVWVQVLVMVLVQGLVKGLEME